MACQYTVDHQQKLVIIRASGVLNDTEWMDHRAKLQADESIDQSFNHFIDLVLIAKIKLTRGLVKPKIGDYLAPAINKTAVYVKDPVAWGLIRLYSGYSADDKNIRRFKSAQLAMNWLAKSQSMAFEPN